MEPYFKLMEPLLLSLIAAYPIGQLFANQNSNESSSVMVWKGDQPCPTGASVTFDHGRMATIQEIPSPMLNDSMGWADLAVAVFGKCERLSEEEAKSMDEFIWRDL